MRARLAALLLLGACAGGGRAPVRPMEVVVKSPVGASLAVRVEAYGRLSSATEGHSVEANAAADVPVLIRQIFDEELPEGPVDVVFVVDTTNSMQDDIDAVKRDMRAILEHLRAHNPDYRVGVVAYRDIFDEYLTRTQLFLTDDDAHIDLAISALTVAGGDDWREHVYAGIHTALGQPWRRGASQHIILMGDAPPHDDYANDPRTLESVTAQAQRAPLRVRIHTIGIKCDASCEEALTSEAAEAASRGRVTP